LWTAATALLALAPLFAQDSPYPARTRFVPVQGEREFSGRMIARPLQLMDLQARGMDRAEMTENQVAAQLMATGDFQYVEPGWIVFPIAGPNDPQFGSQWHHQANRMNSCAGWDITTGDPTVSVGVCDTGVLTTHEDLQLQRPESLPRLRQRGHLHGQPDGHQRQRFGHARPRQLHHRQSGRRIHRRGLHPLQESRLLHG